jgi:hypothetical protein
VLPGEDVAEWCYLTLESAEAAAAAGDVDALVAAVTAEGRPELPTAMTAALRDAIDAMTAVLDDAAADPAGVCGDRRDEWTAASQTARRRVVRMSLEMRMVCSVQESGPGR